MKTIKAIVAIFLAATFITPAFAGTNSETGAGALVGALMGRGICHNCNTRNQNIATGVGALAGAFTGYSMGDRNDRRMDQQQQRINNDAYANQNYQTRTVAPVYVNSNQPVQSNDGWVDMGPAQVAQVAQETRVVRQPVIVHTDYVQPVQQPVRRVQRGDCDEEYYHGNYNPQAAHAYCEGRRQREREVLTAYQEGLNGE